MLETFGDLQELREAIVAVQAACDLPIVAQVSLTDDGQLLTGESPAEVARLLASFQVDVIGVNCGVGPQSTLDAVRQMALPLFAQTSAMPNAARRAAWRAVPLLLDARVLRRVRAPLRRRRRPADRRLLRRPRPTSPR